MKSTNHNTTLHIAVDEEAIVIWAEDPSLNNRGIEDLYQKHPRSVGQEETKTLLRKAGLIDVDDILINRTYLAAIPTEDCRPTSPYSPPTSSYRKRPKIGRWAVNSLVTAHPLMTRILSDLNGKKHLQPDIMLAPDTQYWAHAVRFGISIAARQQFIPSLDRHTVTTRARWMPVFEGPDAANFTLLAAAMPPSARALTKIDRENPVNLRTKERTLHRFIIAVVDSLAKEGASLLTGQQPDSDGSTYDYWTYRVAQLGKGNLFRRSPAKRDHLEAQIAEWLAPVSPIPNQRKRICFVVGINHGDAENPWLLENRLQDIDQPEMSESLGDIWNQNLPALINPEHDLQGREPILASLGHAASISETIAQALKQNWLNPAPIDPWVAVRFTNDEAPALRAAGFGVITSDEPDEEMTGENTSTPGTGDKTGQEQGLNNPFSILVTPWAKRWIREVSFHTTSNRITEGMELTQNNRVKKLAITRGLATAKVLEKDHIANEVILKFSVLPNHIRHDVTDALSERMDLCALIVAGQSHPDVEKLFNTRRADLFPHPTHQVQYTCPCPDQNRICRHIVAVHIAIALRLDDNPATILALRGIDTNRITRSLPKAGQSLNPGSRAQENLFPSNPATFWHPDQAEEPFPSFEPARIPDRDADILDRLGPFPDSENDQPIADTLRPMYRNATKNAMKHVTVAKTNPMKGPTDAMPSETELRESQTDRTVQRARSPAGTLL